MREIKVRVWDEVVKEFFYIDLKKQLCDDGWYIEESLIDMLVFELFTGLRDSRDVEIYEGDILQHRANNSATAKVVFLDGAFIAEHVTLPERNENAKYLKWQAKWQSLIEYVSNEVNIKSTVIGNIHENGEMVDGSDD